MGMTQCRTIISLEGSSTHLLFSPSPGDLNAIPETGYGSTGMLPPSTTPHANRPHDSLASWIDSMKILLVLGALLLFMSCAARRSISPSTVARTNAPQGSWVDLIPETELRIENAYFEPGVPRQGFSGYLGTEIARFQVRRDRGLWPLGVQTPLATRPSNQPSAQELIRPSQTRYLKYRFYYAVVFTQKGTVGGPVLLGALSLVQLERLGRQLLAEPDSLCGDRSLHCTIFPDTCTVSLEMQIVVNGATRTVPWRSILASVAPGARHIELVRRLGVNRSASQSINAADPEAVRMALSPGDEVNWE
jgi:hypothetical protein